MVRAVALRDPGWTDDDRNWLLALQYVERDTCGGCGQSRTESWDRSTAGTWQVVENECQSCKVRDAVAENKAKDGRVRGSYLTVKRTDGLGGG